MTVHFFFIIGFHPMVNSWWVTLIFFFAMQSQCISCHDQEVSDIAFFLYHAVSLHFISWSTVGEWHCFFSLPCILIAFHPMANRKWRTLLFFFTIGFHPMTNSWWVTLLFFLCHAVSMYFIWWPTESKWYGIFSLPCSLITLFCPMTNRKWATLHFSLYHAVSLDPITWPTVCEWHCIFSLPVSLLFISWPTESEWQCIFSLPLHFIHGQQKVSDTNFSFIIVFHPTMANTESEWHYILSLPCSLSSVTNSWWATLHSFPMQSHCISSCGSLWVTLHSFSLLCSLITFHPWLTGSEWHCICFSCSLIAFHLMANREWVTLLSSLHFIPWPTVGEWHCFFSFPCHNLIALHLMTNRKWVTLFFPLYHQSHCISSNDQQYASDTAFSLLCGLIAWPTVCEWHCLFLFVMLIASHFMTNRKWVTLPFSLPCSLISCHPITNRLWEMFLFLLHYAVSLHFIPWSTESEWHCMFFFTMQPHCISCHDQQYVSDIGFFL